MTDQMLDNATPGGAVPATRVFVGASEIIAAATALAWAAQWDTAARLLASARASAPDAAAARRLALATAAVAVHHDFRAAGARWAPDAMAAAAAEIAPEAGIATEPQRTPEPEAATGAEPALRRKLDLLRLQYDYEITMTEPDGTPRFGPEGRDPARLAALARRAEELADAADVAGSGWAAFYRGLIADNLIGDRDGAPRWFARALDAAERASDDYLAGEALRHLGDHEMDAGDLTAARASWERSAGLWAGIGNMTGVLAQQVLLADLAFGEGNPAGGLAIAAEVSRWAGAAGLALYQMSADALIESHRPPH
jgi:hypothetical protein